jgi:hypothetical protein
MERVHVEWLLPIAQLALAVFCNIYGPHEYRVSSRQARVLDNMEYLRQHYPGVAERLSQGVNFPALVLDYPLRNQDSPIYRHDTGYTLIWIAPREIGFFLGVVLLWHWVGCQSGPRRERSRSAPPHRNARIIALMLGMVFGALTGAYAAPMIASPWRPENQIGGFGIAWSLALIMYFAWQLWQMRQKAGKAGDGRDVS